jgi:hypothetical protein
METVSPVDRPELSARVKGVLYMSAYGVLFALVEALGGAVLAEYSPYQVVWGRYLVHLVLTLGVMLVMHKSISICSSCPAVQLSRSATMLVMPVAFVLAAGEAPARFVWTMTWLAPLVVLAWERWFRGVGVGSLDWVIGVACVTGTVLVLRPPPEVFLAGTVLASLSAASLGLYISLTGELRGDAILTSLLYTAMVPFAAMSFVVPWVWTPISPRAGLLLIGVGSFGWLALFVLDKGVRLLGAARGAPFAFLAVITGALISRETRHATVIAGAGIIGITLAGAAMRAVHAGKPHFKAKDSKNER